jgi:hypothetical protein
MRDGTALCAVGGDVCGRRILIEIENFGPVFGWGRFSAWEPSTSVIARAKPVAISWYWVHFAMLLQEIATPLCGSQ